MPWLSRQNFTPTDKLHADDLNNLANDDRTWGGDVNGGGWTLSNVHIIEAGVRTAGAVSSVFARVGDVVAMAGDYTAAQVGAVPIARQVIAGPGLTGGGPLSTDVTLTAAVQSFGTPPRTGAITLTAADITTAGGVLNTRQVKTLAGSGLSGGGALSADLSLSVLADTTNQQVQVMSQGNPIGSPRHAINFISGTGALITVSEISASNRIDVTVASTGTGGGMVDPTQVVGDLIVRGLTAPATRMPVGTDGQVLTADHLQALGVKWATPANVGQVTSVFTRTGAVTAVVGDYSAAQVTNAVDQTGSYNNPPWIASLPWSKITNPPAFMLDPTVAKGDLIVHGAATTRLPLGSDGSILTADSTLAAGVKWGALAVSSVFGRAGAVVAQAGDYTVAQVTGAVPTTLTINTGTGLQGGGNLSSNRTFAVVPDTTNQQLQVLLAGALVGTRHAINFVNGANVSLSISDNVGSNQIDLTVSSTGGSGGMVDPTTGIGDLIVRGATAVQRLGVGLNGQVLTSDNTQALGVRWAPAPSGGAGSQTPWIGNVDAANFNLNNVGGIGVNIASNKTVARIYALTNASEDGFRTVNNTAAGMAGAAFINDVADSVSIRSYGSGFVGGLPGLATIEATKALALLANAAEVMRLTTGRVLIGTTTDDGLNMLQVNGKVKSKVGGFVFPDSTIQTTAYTSASSPVTSVFTRTGAVVQVVGDYSAAQVTNAVDSSSTYSNPSWISSLAWSKITGAPALLVDPTTGKGDIIARGATGPATRLAASTTNNWVLTADTAAALGVKWAAIPPAPQTPWASDIDGAGFTLKSVAKIGVGIAVPQTLLHVKQGSAGFAPLTGGIFLENSGAAAYIETACAAVGDSCGYLFSSGASMTSYIIDLANTWTFWSAARPAIFHIGGNERMRITTAGNVGIGITVPNATLHVGRNTGASGPSIGLQNSFSPSNNAILSFKTNTGAANWDVGTDYAGTGGTEFYFVNNVGTRNVVLLQNGNAGIGTTGPGARLSVASSGSWVPVSTAGMVGIGILSSGAFGGGIGMIDGTNMVGMWGQSGLWVFGNGVTSGALTSRMVIDSSGNIGIGTTGPSKLGSSTPHSIVTQTRSMLVVGDTTQNGTDDGLIQFGSFGFVSSNNWTGIAMLSRNLAAKSVGNVDTYYTPLTTGIGYTACVLDGSGNIVFASNGASATAGQAVSPTALMTILRSGSVGIGTTNPTFRFGVAGGRSDFVPASETYALGVRYQAGGPIFYMGADLNGDCIFSEAGGVERMRLRGDGGGLHIGGSGRAAYPLDVVGDINYAGGVIRRSAQPCGMPSTINNMTASHALNTVYQNPYGLPIFVNVTCMVNANQYMQFYTDSGNPPGTITCVASNAGANSATLTVGTWVMAGHYYKVFHSGGSLTTWIEFI